MIILILSISYTVYLFYLFAHLMRRTEELYSIKIPPLPRPLLDLLPYPEMLHVFLLIIWGIIILGGMFWGYTYEYELYHGYIPLRGSVMALWFLLILFFAALPLTFAIIFQMGKGHGINCMKLHTWSRPLDYYKLHGTDE
jgi:hypothetical protein